MQITNQLSHSAETILAEAVSEEFHASHLYKHLANQCRRIGLFGAAKYFTDESADELSHYEKLATYFNDRGSVAQLPDVEAIDVPITKLEEALSTALNAEIALGAKYSEWYKELLTDDPMTAQFLLQFLEIQRLSIGGYADWLSRLALAGDILVIDQELGA